VQKHTFIADSCDSTAAIRETLCVKHSQMRARNRMTDMIAADHLA
jgi:hypothetical protein